MSRAERPEVCGQPAAATEPSEVRAEVAGPHAPAADHYMYVCGEAGGAGPRYECAFDGGPMEQPPFEEHMFGEFGKERHVQVVVGAGGELQYRDDLPVFATTPPNAPSADVKRKDEPLLLPPDGAPPPPPAHSSTPTTSSKKSDKKKNDNNGIKKKKTR